MKTAERHLYNGNRHTVAEIVNMTGLSKSTVRDRLRHSLPMVRIERKKKPTYKPAKYIGDFTISNLDDITIREISVAVVRQAVDDWRYLCRGGEETRYCNFKELEQFFKVECASFISSDETADRIWRQMRKERRTLIE